MIYSMIHVRDHKEYKNYDENIEEISSSLISLRSSDAKNTFSVSGIGSATHVTPFHL